MVVNCCAVKQENGAFTANPHLTNFEADLLPFNKLPYVKDAVYQSENHERCLSGTRTPQLEQIKNWEAGYRAMEVLVVGCERKIHYCSIVRATFC
jgi:hypothetical protein